MCNMKALFPGQKEEDELIRIFKVVGTPTKDTWPEVEELSHWKNYDFDIYEPKNLAEIVPRLDALGIDLLQVRNVLFVENAAAEPRITNHCKVSPGALVLQRPSGVSPGHVQKISMKLISTVYMHIILLSCW